MNSNSIPFQSDHSENKIDWTPQELQEWVDARLVPIELLAPSRSIELIDYLKINKKMLHNHYRRNPEDDNYIMTIPPSSEWHKAPDIIVTDRRSGEVVNVLEMAGYFELCEGVCLRVKAKEMTDWEKETADVKKLDKEQYETFKAALENYPSDKPLTRKQIVTLIEEVRKPPKNNPFRQARGIIDNKLDRVIEDGQLTFFDMFDANKEKQIKEFTGPIIKGLDFDQAEDRIIHTLTLLLSKKSENRDQKSKDYYMGNYEKGVVSINQIEMETARIIVTPHEFYSTYYGKDNYGSDQINFILNKLDSLSKKMFLTTWNIPKKSKDQEKRYDKFRTNCPLFQLAILNQDLSEIESQEIDNNKFLLEGKKCHFLFKFQPQFTNNIREQYVEFPEDIYLRITKAAGKDRIGQCVNLMRDLLFREKQLKRYSILRDKETIINNLKLDKFWKEGRKKMVNEKIQECVDIFLEIGLLKEWKEVHGKRGQVQYQIQINRDFK